MDSRIYDKILLIKEIFFNDFQVHLKQLNSDVH